jgi:hypothetical protein
MLSLSSPSPVVLEGGFGGGGRNTAVVAGETAAGGAPLAGAVEDGGWCSNNSKGDSIGLVKYGDISKDI